MMQVEALPKKANASYYAQITGAEEAQILFPDPGPLEGLKGRVKPVASLKTVTFRYTLNAQRASWRSPLGTP